MLFDSPSTFGRAFRILTFGESHGAAVGVVIDGVKPGLAFDLQDIQRELDRRRPGQSDLVTPRQEADPVQVLSGHVTLHDCTIEGTMSPTTALTVQNAAVAMQRCRVFGGPMPTPSSAAFTGGGRRT